MNTKSIEMTLLYENGYGKIYINKDYHLVDVETENPKDFFESLKKISCTRRPLLQPYRRVL